MSEPFIGQIEYFGFNFAPRNWAFCNGQLLPINQNAALFSLLGTTYGGNGTTTFALPDLRGRTAIHWGSGPGLSNYSLGQVSGTETVTLLTTQMPAHVHSATYTPTTQPVINAATAKATASIPSAGALLARSVDDSPNPGAQVRIYAPAGTTPTVSLGGVNVAGTTAIAGSNVPVSNLPPYLTINTCIALFGIFPSRN